MTTHTDSKLRLLIERGEELMRGSEADKQVGLALFVLAQDQSTAMMRELERKHPALKAIGRIMREQTRPRKLKA